MPKSPVIRLVDLLWDNAQKATGHSWTRLNGALHQSIYLAIEAGLKFAPGDFEYIWEHYNSGYWIGDGNGEGWYSRAVEYDNRSACISFEKQKGRKPFILNGKRLAIGTRIDSVLDRRAMINPDWLKLEWSHFLTVQVGSFFDGGINVFAKWDAKKKDWTEKPNRRWKVTYEDIAKANALLRSDEKARQDAQKKEEAA